MSATQSANNSSSAQRLIVGLDVHQTHTTMHVLNADGKRIERRTIKGHWTLAVAEVEKLSERTPTDHDRSDSPQGEESSLTTTTNNNNNNNEVHVCFEASIGAGRLYDLLRPRCHRVVVAHPGQLRLIFRSKQKNDRGDAEKLAKLLFLDEVPAAYMPAKATRNWRKLIETRNRTVQKRVRVKNSLRALLRGMGQVVPKGLRLWTDAGRRWLTRLELDETEALARDLWLDELDLLNRQIGRLEAELDRIAYQVPAVALLRTIPGVGPRTAEAIVAYIDKPDRFSKAKQVGAYFGLVPSQDQSGKTNRLGHITKEGPATARKFLTEAAWQAIRCSQQVKARFVRVHRNDPERRKIALVATSHYLVRVMHAMLRTNRPWDETKLPAFETPAAATGQAA